MPAPMLPGERKREMAVQPLLGSGPDAPPRVLDDLERAMTEHDVVARVRAEYQEMPGLTLTVPQAARLFNLEREACERVLNHLVSGGILWTDGRQFAHSQSGRRVA